jgi:hypothetical protein
MSTIQEIETAISRLPPEELRQLSRWFETFEADQWDRQMAADAGAGKLEALAEKALQDYREGRCTEL